MTGTTAASSNPAPRLTLREQVPHLGVLLEHYSSGSRMHSAVANNVQILRCIRGGLRMALARPLVFDPRAEYWRKPERRFLVAYFAGWTDYFYPPEALRRHALHVFQHFERARAEGVISYFGVDYDEAGGQTAICDSLIEYARRLPPTAAWDELRPHWKKRARTAVDDLVNFFERAKTADNWEIPFAKRQPWFGYLGASSLEQVRERQAFFYAYANLWTTTNAYVFAGAQSFASVIQNTTTATGLDYPKRWRSGERPPHTGFPTLARADEQMRDRSDYTPVIEVFGFLNLHREPFYNGLAEPYRDWLGETPSARDDDNGYDLTQRIADRTSAWLTENPQAIPKLVAILEAHLSEPLQTRVSFEGLRPRSFEFTNPELHDEHWRAELERHARDDLSALTERERAIIALHLLLDSEMYLLSIGKEPAAETRNTVSSRPPPSNSNGPQSQHELRQLPASLRVWGDRALAYLHANLHVMFAGPPGTGKTTLAQFVGYAWNHRLLAVPEILAAADAPLTTVGNSAWSPFHTIGGIVPLTEGGFTTRPGIFVQPTAYGSNVWCLRNEAVVLDEMNRADLDRCIGELYPLLSGSVMRVVPAGLPEVNTIELSERFRLLATVNDSSVDDIVFPISEGLSRRFQRIELPGASREDVDAYLGYSALAPSGNSPRHTAARDAIETLFVVAREADVLSEDDDAERLPFGVGYFALLAAWAKGSLRFKLLGKDATETEEATDLLISGLRVLARRPRWNEILTKVAAYGGK